MIGKIIQIEDKAYMVKQIIRPWFEKAINHYGIKKIKEELNCDRIIKDKQNNYLLVELIKDAHIIKEE